MDSASLVPPFQKVRGEIICLHMKKSARRRIKVGSNIRQSDKEKQLSPPLAPHQQVSISQPYFYVERLYFFSKEFSKQNCNCHAHLIEVMKIDEMLI